MNAKLVKFITIAMIVILILSGCGGIGKSKTAFSNAAATATAIVESAKGDAMINLAYAEATKMIAESSPIVVATVAPAAVQVPVQPVVEQPVAVQKSAEPVAEAPKEEVKPTEVAPIAEAPAIALMPYFFMDDSGYGRVATDVNLTGASISDCSRWWQAVGKNKVDGSQNVPWVHLMCSPKATSPDFQFAFTIPTRYKITSPAGQQAFSFTVVRDMNAVAQLKDRGDKYDPDPYTVAIKGDWSKKSDKQLSLYVSGTGSIQKSDGSWLDLTTVSAVEIYFPKDLKEGLNFNLSFKDGGVAEIWQGASENGFVATDKLHKDVPLVQLPTISVW